MTDFLRQALLDWLEELSDICEVPKLRQEPARPLEAVLDELDSDRIGRSPTNP